MAKKVKIKKGTGRMRQLGYQLVNIWLTAETAERLDFVRGNCPRATYARQQVAAAINADFRRKNAS